MEKLNYEKVFCTLVDKTREYIQNNNLSAMVLGISGGIDSTVVAAICHEVSKRTGIPLIGRSLPIKNKNDEFGVSRLVGEAFCDDFAVCPMTRLYHAALKEVYQVENMERHIASLLESNSIPFSFINKIDAVDIICENTLKFDL